MQYRNIKHCAQRLLLRVDHKDDDGRDVGLTYHKIIKRIQKVFPVVRTPGPHCGKPVRLTVKELQKIAYNMNRDDPGVRLPIRPRKRPIKKKKS